MIGRGQAWRAVRNQTPSPVTGDSSGQPSLSKSGNSSRSPRGSRTAPEMAVLDPRGLRELFPDFERDGCPLESPVTGDGVWFLTARHAWPLPIIPPPLRNHGNYVASLGTLVRWLASQAEATGVELLPGFAAAAPLLEGDRVVGVRTGDKGIDRNGTRKPNFEPGIDVRARVTVLCEGPRGTITKVLVNDFGLDAGRQPQVYAVGIKEVWQCPT